jgi:hypothetical protein
MEQTNIILSSLVSILLIVMLLPSIAKLNHGVLLRNAALWLALFLSFGLIYKNFMALPEDRPMPPRHHMMEGRFPPDFRHLERPAPIESGEAQKPAEDATKPVEESAKPAAEESKDAATPPKPSIDKFRRHFPIDQLAPPKTEK